MGIKAASEQPIEELRQFQKQILDLLKSYQGNRLVDAESKAYQDSLEKLLEQLNKTIQNGNLTKLDANRIDSLMDAAETVYGQMKNQNVDNKKFQKQFVKVFGNEPLEGSLAKLVAQSFSQSLRQFQQTLAQAVQPIKQNAMDTALYELTGPFGALVKETINFGAIKDYFRRRKEHQQEVRSQRTEVYKQTRGDLDASVKGIFAGGATDIPDHGSYYLHKGERVVAPEQNKDLSTFLDQVKKIKPENSRVGDSQKSLGDKEMGFLSDIAANVQKAKSLLESEVASGYFDPLLENQDRLFIIGQKDKYRFNKRLFENLETIELGIFNVGSTLYGTMISLVLGFKRFMRHPFWYSVGWLAEPFIKGVRVIWEEFFGKKKDEEEMLRDSVDRIYEFLVDQERHREKTWGQMFLKRLVNFTGAVAFAPIFKLLGLNLPTLRNAQRTRERIEEEGHRRGLGGIADRLYLMGYDPFLEKHALSRKARKADHEYGYSGGLRDIRYATRNMGKATGFYNIMLMLGLLDEEDLKKDGVKVKRRLHDYVEKLYNHYYLDPIKKAGKAFSKNVVDNSKYVHSLFYKGYDAGKRFLFGDGGQRRDERGRFLPRQHGVFHNLFSKKNEHGDTKAIRHLKELGKWLKKIYEMTLLGKLFSGLMSVGQYIWGKLGTLFTFFGGLLTEKLLPSLLKSITAFGGFFTEKLLPLLGRSLSAIGGVLMNPEVWAAAAAGAIGYAIGSAIWKGIEDTPFGRWISNNIVGTVAESLGLGVDTMNKAAAADPNIKTYANDPRFISRMQQLKANADSSGQKFYADSAAKMTADDLYDKDNKKGGYAPPSMSTRLRKDVTAVEKKVQGQIPAMKAREAQVAKQIREQTHHLERISHHLKNEAENKTKNAMDKGQAKYQQNVKPSVDDLGTYLVAHGR